MSIFRLILILAPLLVASGCAPDNREIQKANQTIARLEAEVQQLKAENLKLRNLEETLIGEIGFSQGCRFLISICFGRDAVGSELVRQGYTAHGSLIFLAWIAFKFAFIPMLFIGLSTAVTFVMNTWLFPSASKQKAAYEIIEKATKIRAENARIQQRYLEEIRASKYELESKEAELKARRMRVWRYVKLKKTELENLYVSIVQLERQIETLEVAREVEEAFSRRKR